MPLLAFDTENLIGLRGCYYDATLSHLAEEEILRLELLTISKNLMLYQKKALISN